MTAGTLYDKTGAGGRVLCVVCGRAGGGEDGAWITGGGAGGWL